VRALGLRSSGDQLPAPGSSARILPQLDYVSMDFKAPSATGLTAEQTWAKHREFLEAAQAVNVYVNWSSPASTTEEELDVVVATINAVDSRHPPHPAAGHGPSAMSRAG